jgi:DUF4097 and DUF4098 domain-containing protein YvlB
MQRLLIASVAAAAALTAAPARAQVYPERIVITSKARTVSTHTTYQRRDDNRAEEVERTTKTFKLGASGALTLGNISGDIVVTRGNGPDTTVEIVKTARGRDSADARELLQLVTVEATERNGRADVKAQYPNGDDMRRRGRRGINVNVAYTVTAPAGTRIQADSISGNVRVTDMKGDVSANTISGDVRIAGGGRVSSAKTISGNVEIADAQVDGALESSSVSGDVVLRRVTARRIDAGSVSGAIKLEDVQAERVSAHSTSSDIWMTGTLAKNGRYELKGFSGDVRVVLGGTTGFELDASSFSGDISARDFTFTSTRGRGRHSLSGTYGDGSAILDLSTFSGSIVISKR